MWFVGDDLLCSTLSAARHSSFPLLASQQWRSAPELWLSGHPHSSRECLTSLPRGRESIPTPREDVRPDCLTKTPDKHLLWFLELCPRCECGSVTHSLTVTQAVSVSNLEAVSLTKTKEPKCNVSHKLLSIGEWWCHYCLNGLWALAYHKSTSLELKKVQTWDSVQCTQ